MFNQYKNVKLIQFKNITPTNIIKNKFYYPKIIFILINLLNKIFNQ